MINRAPVHILCFGNLWHGDDGFGLHVLRRLREHRRLPPHVRAFDAGTAGLSALPLFEGCTKAVLVDAIKVGTNIGRLHRLTFDDCVPDVGQRGMHGAGIEYLFAALPIAFADSTMPEVVLIGAEVGDITPFTATLSPPVAGAMTHAVELVILECGCRVSATTPGRTNRRRAPGVS